MFPEWLKITLLVVYLLAGLGATMFFLLYLVLIKWHKAEESANLLAFSGVMALALDQSILRLAFGSYPGFQTIILVMILGIFAVVWWRLILFIRLYRRGRREEKK